MVETRNTNADTAAGHGQPLRRFIALERRLSIRANRSAATFFLYEFIRFGMKQAWACLFGGLMVALLLATYAFYPQGAWLARYDFLFLAAVVIQIGMIGLKLETIDEARVIFLFHCVGTAMEVFKTAKGSWIYPEESLFRIGDVPLFTGFMYAAVGSYIARAWRLFDFRFTRYPPQWAMYALATAIYLNFFTHHYGPDLRYGLFAVYALLFGRCWIHYRVHRHWRRMPVLLATLLVALFIWGAENVGTFTRTWLYPSQKAGWEMVSIAKLGSWYLLMIISVALVSIVTRPQAFSAAPSTRTGSPRPCPQRWPQPPSLARR